MCFNLVIYCCVVCWFKCLWYIMTSQVQCIQWCSYVFFYLKQWTRDIKFYSRGRRYCWCHVRTDKETIIEFLLIGCSIRELCSCSRCFEVFSSVNTILFMRNPFSNFICFYTPVPKDIGVYFFTQQNLMNTLIFVLFY